MIAKLNIETQDFTVKNLQFPDYLIDKVSSNPSYVEVKRDLEEIFTVFFHSDGFKTTKDTECYRMLHYSLHQLLDDMFLGINNGRMNHVQEQIDTFNHDKEKAIKIKV